MLNIKSIIILIAIVMYALVIVFQSRKVIFTSVAALLIIVLGMIFPGKIFPLPEDIISLESNTPSVFYALTHSFLEIINWNVLMIYLGTMIIASLFIYSKVPAKIADKIVNKSSTSSIAMVLILAMTGVISIFVENVATVLMMAPIALALCNKLRINPTVFMIGIAVMSNLEGTATLVGDPPSMIFASYAGYSFNDFFFHNGMLSIFWLVQIGMIAGCAFFYLYFARHNGEKVVVDSDEIISWVPFSFLIIMIIGLGMISIVSARYEYLSGGFVLALGIILLAWYKLFQRKTFSELKQIVIDLDWETIFFLLGVFVVIGAIKETGILYDLALYLVNITGGSKILGYVIIFAVSIVISGFVDNVPYMIAMLPVAAEMARAMEVNSELYMFALLIGSCLGGNLTPYGASANVVAMGILKKENRPLNFAGWLKIGGTFTVVTTVVVSLALWLIWS